MPDQQLSTFTAIGIDPFPAKRDLAIEDRHRDDELADLLQVRVLREE